MILRQRLYAIYGGREPYLRAPLAEVRLMRLVVLAEEEARREQARREQEQIERLAGQGHG